jgi:hypothetical protein
VRDPVEASLNNENLLIEKIRNQLKVKSDPDPGFMKVYEFLRAANKTEAGSVFINLPLLSYLYIT